MAIVDPRQHTGTGWRAERTTVGVVESHSFVCEAVNIWGLEMLLPVAAEHPASEVVCEDENYIRVIGHNNDTKFFRALPALKSPLSVEMLEQVTFMRTVPRDLICRDCP